MHVCTSVAIVVIFVGSAPAAAQSPPSPPPVQPPAPPAPGPAPPAALPPKAPQPGRTLDELLGIPKSGETGGAATPPKIGTEDEALKKARERVQRTLDEEEVDSLLQQVLGDMRSSAERLSSRGDPGLDTQRMQRGVVEKLDVLIQQAQRRKQQAGGSSSSSSSDSRRPQDGDAQPKDPAGQQKPADSASRERERNSRGDSTPLDPPEGEEPTDEQKLLDETRSEWGSLPARVRELIRQGSRDRVASLYQRLTQEYYRRMAEDASR